MALGYVLGTKSNVTYRPRISASDTKEMFSRYIKFSFIITAFTFIPRFIIDTGFYDFNFEKLVLKIVMGSSNAQVAYIMNKNVESAVGVWKIINHICVATSFISWSYTALSIIVWDKLSLWKKLFTITYWIVLVLQNLAQGTNFGIFDLALQISIFYLIKNTIISKKRKENEDQQRLGMVEYSDYPLSNSHKRRNSFNYKKYVLVALFFIIIAITSFSTTMGSRVGGSYEKIVSYKNDYIAINENSLLWKVCPQILRPLLAILSSYISHGYMGLAMAFNVPFTSTFGIGNSWFMLFNFREYTGIDLLSRTYLMKIYNLYNYDYSGYWHTAYLWFANDVSIFGVPFILFILMYIYGFAWKDFLQNDNIFALLLMTTYIVFFAFISANNQVFSSPQTLFSFWVYLFTWLSTRKKYNWNTTFL